MDFIESQGVEHETQRLYVHWDITTMCQYKCSYCYARKQYGKDWGRPGIWKNQLKVVDELSKSSLPVFLGLLGGEPTMHHRYFELLDLINEKVLTHDRSRLYITTNGVKHPEFFQQHKDTDGRIFMLWSIHPEFTGDEEFENLYRNIELMHSKGYRTKINLMLHPDEKYWTQTKERYERLNQLEYTILHPHFIYGGFNHDVEYGESFYDYFKFLEGQRVKEFIFTSEDKEFVFSDYEIFDKGHNRFKGWKCWHNNFEINYKGLITDQCFHPHNFEIPKNYFRDITEVKPRICSHEFCSCDGLMKIHKERDDRVQQT